MIATNCGFYAGALSNSCKVAFTGTGAGTFTASAANAATETVLLPVNTLTPNALPAVSPAEPSILASRPPPATPPSAPSPSPILAPPRQTFARRLSTALAKTTPTASPSPPRTVPVARPRASPQVLPAQSPSHSPRPPTQQSRLPGRSPIPTLPFPESRKSPLSASHRRMPSTSARSSLTASAFRVIFSFPIGSTTAIAHTAPNAARLLALLQHHRRVPRRDSP